MTFDMDKVLESKKALRVRLAGLPVAEKLRMLDALRERTLTIRKAGSRSQAAILRESPLEYGVHDPKD